MAWQIAVVFDEGDKIETLHSNLYILLGQMPVWAIAERERVPGATELREQWEKCWWPEPGLTLVKPADKIDRTVEALQLIPVVREHHPRMAAVRYFGLEQSETLEAGMARLGFSSVTGSSWDGIGFAKRLNQLEELVEIEVDAKEWKSENDFYDAFFDAVGSPDWHGRNLDALNDSIGGGAINQLEVPYRLILKNARENDRIAEFIHRLANVIARLQANGCPVELRIG